MSRIIAVREDTTGRRTVRDDGDQLRILEGVTLDLDQDVIVSSADNIRIDVRGTVESTRFVSSSTAIYAINLDSSNVDLNVYATGSIIGGTRGVLIGGADANIFNAGTISATGIAIDFYGGEIVNEGTIENNRNGFQNDYAIAIYDGDTTIRNREDGVIVSVGNDAIVGLTSQTRDNTLTVINDGLIEASRGDGINFVNVNVVNRGTISTSTEAVNGWSGSLLNFGTISITTSNWFAVNFSRSESTVDNRGTIEGGGIYVAKGSALNQGTINLTDSFAVGLASFETADVENRGIITGSGIGMRVSTSGDVVNSGTIDVGRFGVEASSLAVTNIINSGTIIAEFGALLERDSFVNTGSIEATSRAVIMDQGAFRNGVTGTITSLNSEAVDMGDFDGLFVNRGVVTGGSGVAISFGTRATAQVVNSGVLNGDIVDTNSEFSPNTPQIVLNSGTINGSVDLGGGDDRYDGRGGTVTGVIDMGDGDDSVLVGAGDETIDGGDGNDLVRFSGAIADYETTVNLDGSVTVADLRSGPESDGTDTLTNVELLRFSDTIIRTTDLNPDIFISEDTNDNFVLLVSQDITIEDGATLSSVSGSEAGAIVGSAGSHTVMIEGAVIDVILNAAIDLSASAGSVVINRGAVTGDILFGEGDDTYNGLRGMFDDEGPFISMGGGNDTAIGGARSETFLGGSGNDVLRGGGGDDTLDGGLGSDALNGGDGADLMFGGGGDDRLYGRAGDDILDGGDGTDTARYTGDLADFDVTDNGDGTFTVTDLRAGGPEGTDTLSNIEVVEFNDGSFDISSTVISLEGLG